MLKNTMKEIKIRLSRFKIILLTFGSLCFVVLGIFMWTSSETEAIFTKVFNRVICLLDFGFFGLCGVYGLFKLFDNKPGLIINDDGIFDNSSAVSGHLIKWKDIIGIEIGLIRSTKFLLIFVNNPEYYLNHSNRFKRFWMRMNEKKYGTPLSISANSLQLNIDKLIEMIRKEFAKHDVQQRV
jgi:hypothetical protein